ncbi:MAG: hypothetical protein AAGD43_06770 [Pseudomonadota bacterium]
MFDVKVMRVNESEHKEPEFEIKATAITVSEDGSLSIVTKEGGKHLSASTWGAVSITCVPSAKKRL